MRKNITLRSSVAVMALGLGIGSVLATASLAQINNAVSQPRFHGAPAASAGQGDNLGDHAAEMNLNMRGFQVIDLGDPGDLSHAVNLGYLQTAVQGARDNLGNHIATRNLDLDGFEIVSVGDPSTQTSAVNLRTLNDAIAAGGDNLGNHIATLDLNLNFHRVLNLSDPSGPRDGVNLRTLEEAIAAAPGDNLGDHTATTHLNMTGHRVTGVSNPSDGSDAVNLETLETAIAGVTGAIPSPLAAGDGVSIVGNVISVNGTVVRTLGDQTIAGSKTFTAPVSLSGQRLLNVASPVSATDGVNRAWVEAQIDAIPDAPTYTGGTGISVAGTVISFDTGWGDDRYALRSRLISAGLGMTGGGSLANNLSLGFDTSWGDARYADHVVSGFSSAVTYDSIFGISGNGASTFGHAQVDAPSDAPVVSQASGVHIGNVGGRAQMVFPNNTNRAFFRSGTRTAWNEVWHSGNLDPSSLPQSSRRIDAGTGLTGGGNLSADRTISFDTTWGDGRYALRARNITAGDGLGGGGNLTADRTIAVDATVLRTTGGQNIDRAVANGVIMSWRGRDGAGQTTNTFAFQPGTSVTGSAGRYDPALVIHTTAARNFWFATTGGADFHMRVQGPITATGDVRARDFYGRAYYHTSDASLKANVVQLDADRALGNVWRLRPVSYDWIDGGGEAMGLIAQEVAEVFPSAVAAREDGILTVDYSQLISPMIATIQHLGEELDAERRQTSELQAIIGDLEERLQAIEALLR